MRELDEITDAEWAPIARSVRGVFADVDDTLTDHGIVVPAAYAALASAHAAGLRMVLVTGRPAGWGEVLASLFPIDAAIAENGALAALPGGRRLYFDDEVVRKRGAAQRHDALARLRAELPSLTMAADARLREIDLAFDIAEHERVPEPTIARAVEILRDTGLTTTRSSIHLHGTFSRADKAKMCARISQELWGEAEDATRDHYLFIGDSPNDAPAFAFFRHAIGVANLRAHAASLGNALPFAITKERTGRGFADAIARLLSAREGLDPR